MNPLRGPWKKAERPAPALPKVIGLNPPLPTRSRASLEAEEETTNYRHRITLLFDVSPGLWWLLLFLVVLMIWLKA